jgi:hypothetical protein
MLLSIYIAKDGGGKDIDKFNDHRELDDWKQ